jgi:hypothetical protein
MRRGSACFAAAYFSLFSLSHYFALTQFFTPLRDASH